MDGWRERGMRFWGTKDPLGIEIIHDSNFVKQIVKLRKVSLWFYSHRRPRSSPQTVDE